MKYVFLHGMGQNAASWEKTISFLPEGTEAVCPELSDFFTEFLFDALLPGIRTPPRPCASAGTPPSQVRGARRLTTPVP